MVKELKLFILMGICTLWLCVFAHTAHAQANGNAYHIGLVVPLFTEATTERLNDFINATDQYTANKIKLNEEALTALDFYQGLQLAASQHTVNVQFHIYDSKNNDSITQQILKQPELKKMDVLIGASHTSGARMVADYCKTNRIVNLQPFSPSKSLTSNNPYHIKLVPTIDSHIDNMFLSIADSFPGANIIVLSPNKESSTHAAARMDSLIVAYNKTADKKFTYCVLNAKDMTWKGQKTTVGEQLKAGRKNIWVITSFEEAFVNGNMRVLYEKRKSFDIVVYGMPTWLNGDIIRLDYVNDYQTRLTDYYMVDTASEETARFKEAYREKFATEPSRAAYLGYDAGNLMLGALEEYGKDFPSQIATQRFKGVAHKFDITPIKQDNGLSYYENTHVNVFRVNNYKLEKVR